MNDSRPKFRDDVRAHVLADDLVVLDAASGIELLEGRLSSALVHRLTNGMLLPEIIAQVGGALDTFDAAYELDELHRRGLIETAAGGEVPIVLATDYLDPQLAAVNAEALESGRPWMLARPRGPVVWIGPVFAPGHGPCWQCLATRLGAVRAAWQLPERRDDEQPVTRIGLELATLEADRFHRQPDAPARLLTFDTRSLARHEHRIVRLRHCSACGERTPREFTPLVLHNREKAFTFDGGHRAVPPEETFTRYAHHVSALAGIVHHVERANGDTGLLNVFVARHNYITGKQTTPSQSYGKGVTAAQARTGALCEALERYSGAFHGDEPLLRASFRDLGEDAIHPNACYGISESQYEHRHDWNRDAPAILSIPDRFNEHETIDWVPAWSLTHERKRYVPAAYCYYGHRAEFATPDSNGNAAGTCIEDAILQGLLELIERDAAGIWWYGRLHRPGIAFDSPYVRTMAREYAARGRELRLLDLTTDVGIPVCAAVCIGERPENFYLGLGAHLDPALAVTRAITEANQLLAAQRRGRLYRGELPDFSFLEPSGRRELSTVAQPSNDICVDVRNCVEILRGIGLEVIVVDQTREEVGLPVVKVIVPGLRHFRPRFAPGRLYDVPVRLGWRERPLAEHELNPAHLSV